MFPARGNNSTAEWLTRQPPDGRHLYRGRTSALVTALFALPALAQTVTTSRPADSVVTLRPAGAAARFQRVKNPHWKSDSCSACHQIQDSKPLPIAAETIEPLCQSCHDGHRASQENHPSGRRFAAPGTRLPEGWPAPAGRLSCSTCHDIRQACDRVVPRPSVNPVFVRQWTPRDPLAFCHRCHVDADMHARYNPHVMVNENQEPIAAACNFCHRPSIQQHPGRQRAGRPELRMDQTSLCLGCHNQHPDYFEPGHLLAHPPAAMKQHMRRFGARQLPLADGDTIVCSTCHNPHQTGVFAPLSELSFGAMAPNRGNATAELRGFGKDVCHACHDK